MPAETQEYRPPDGGEGGRLIVVPPGWMVADPGTDEILYVCSRPCGEAWSAKDVAAWARSGERMEWASGGRMT